MDSNSSQARESKEPRCCCTLPSQLTRYVFPHFSVSVFITGLNVALFVSYVYLFWRRDKLVTKIWTLLVILLNVATMVTDVWSQWCQSITIFLYEHVRERLIALSSLTGLSSAVMM